MDFKQWIDPEWLPYVMPLIIFCARILDVSIGTLRIVFITRGMKLVAPLLGFFEVLIWVVVVSQVVRNMDSVVNLLAYASGFATGNYVGMFIERKLAVGLLLVRIITRLDATELIACLRNRGLYVTNVPAYGNKGEVNVVFTVIKRKDLDETVEAIQEYNPRAFYTIETIQAVSEGYLMTDKNRLGFFRKLWGYRKGM